MSELAIRLLGPFQVKLDNKTISHFETAKVRVLLAYLAAEAEQPQRREYLAEILWPDRPEGAARANLRHALGVLRSAIGDRGRSRGKPAQPPFLLVTRETIQINAAANIWVDTQAFTQLISKTSPAVRSPILRLEEAAALYRGSFLEDISIEDSVAIQEWILLKQEHLLYEVLNALSQLVRHYELLAEYKRALTYAWRHVELARWDEGAHRQVMRLLALAGMPGSALSHYETCRELLAEELDVEPGEATIELYEQIRDGQVVASSILSRHWQPEIEIPGFLNEAVESTMPPIFVGRMRELAKLEKLLIKALAGHSQLGFVIGGPGRGKTALLKEFSRRIMDAHPELLVAEGNCNAYAGVGDPYLPFRDVMSMLTGDVESRWTAGLITGKHARRLWETQSQAVQAVVEYGSSLVESVLSGESLYRRSVVAQPDNDELLQRLAALVRRQRSGEVVREQERLFEHYTNVLIALAEKHPLVLLLDDIQWADAASIGLLFHLARRLASCRVLILCAYRPEEATMARPGTGHPLSLVLSEFKRTFGDAWIDLGQTEEIEDRQFIAALLEAMAIRLPEELQAALYLRTQGHPLFTVETLRAMQERGDLIRETDGEVWVPGTTLNWDRLPARVEGVIEQRIERLEPELQEIITIASIEGELFRAQVVARVHKTEERALLHRLSGELQQKHRLVAEHREVHPGRRQISFYKFSHALVQEFLYKRLSRSERRLLHGEVAAALEELYIDQLDDVAVQLAHHYQKAEDYEHAFKYFVQAARIATRMYAYDEAATHYTRAIRLAERVCEDGASITELYRERGQAFAASGAFERARADHNRVVQAARSSDAPWSEWRALIDLGKLWASRDYARTLDCFKQALELARQLDDPPVLAESLNWIGNWHLNAAEPHTAVGYHLEALAICERSELRRDLANTLDLLGIACQIGADPKASLGYYDRAIEIYRELNDRPSLVTSLTGRGTIAGAAAHSLTVIPTTTLREARHDLEEALQLAHAIHSPAGEAWAFWSLSLSYGVSGRFERGLAAARKSLSLASSIGHREWIVGSRYAMGWNLYEIYASQEAEHQFTLALTLARELRSQHWINVISSKLAAVNLLLGDLGKARACLETALTPRTPMDSVGKRDCWARRAELALRQDDPAKALEIADRLILSAPGMSAGTVISFLWKLRAEALMELGDMEDARLSLEAAIENARMTGERFQLWRIHAALGRLLRAMNCPIADEEFSRARRLIRELADAISDESLRLNYVEGAHRTLACCIGKGTI